MEVSLKEVRIVLDEYLHLVRNTKDRLYSEKKMNADDMRDHAHLLGEFIRQMDWFFPPVQGGEKNE